MPALTRTRGEVIDLGGGVTVRVTAVGRKLVHFRAALPAGVSVRLTARRPGRPRAGRPAGVEVFHPGRAGPWEFGSVAYPGGTAVFGGAVRLTVTRIEDHGPGRPRVAHIAVDGPAPAPGPAAPRPAAVRTIDELTPAELARAVGWAAPAAAGAEPPPARPRGKRE